MLHGTFWNFINTGAERKFYLWWVLSLFLLVEKTREEYHVKNFQNRVVEFEKERDRKSKANKTSGRYYCEHITSSMYIYISMNTIKIAHSIFS